MSRQLLQVLPALEAAEKALAALNKNDIVEIKTFTKPPPLVQLTLEVSINLPMITMLWNIVYLAVVIAAIGRGKEDQVVRMHMYSLYMYSHPAWYLHT